MVNGVTITTETSAGTMAMLEDAINARSQALQVATYDSMVAAGITILRSLKAETAVAPKTQDKIPFASFKIEATNLFGGLYREKGSSVTKVCARIGGHYGHRAIDVRPAIGFKPGGGAVMRSQVYKIYTSNPYDTFSKNINRGMCWWVLCEHKGQAESYARRHLERLFRNESGMAKYTLSIAQARASTKTKLISLEEAQGKGGMSPKAVKISYEAASIEIGENGFNEGDCYVAFFDKLKYSNPASGGDQALERAIQRASASMIGCFGGEDLKKLLQNFKKRNIKSELHEVLYSHWVVRNKIPDRGRGSW